MPTQTEPNKPQNMGELWMVAGLAIAVLVLGTLNYLLGPISLESARALLIPNDSKTSAAGETVSIDLLGWRTTFSSDHYGMNNASDQDAKLSIVVVDGKKVLNAVGPGQIFTRQSFQVDTKKSYEMSIRIRVLPARDGSEITNRVLAGFATFDEQGKLETAQPGTHRYGVSMAHISSSDGWQEYLGIFSGTGERRNRFRPTTKTVRPVLIFNMDKSTNSITQIESVILRLP